MIGIFVEQNHCVGMRFCGLSMCVKQASGLSMCL